MSMRYKKQMANHVALVGMIHSKRNSERVSPYKTSSQLNMSTIKESYIVTSNH